MKTGRHHARTTYQFALGGIDPRAPIVDLAAERDKNS